MKRHIYFFFASAILAAGCDDDEKPTVYPAEPHIAYKDLEYIEGEYDSLIVTFQYQDGDMDLGLNPEGVDLDSPYHYRNFFVEDGLRMFPLSSGLLQLSAGPYEEAINLGGHTNKRLVTLQTRESAAFHYLPDANSPFYINNILIAETDMHRIYEPYTIAEVLTVNGIQYNRLSDFLYTEPNPAYKNLKVNFFVEHADGSYTEFDWFKEFFISFDGRFPRIPFATWGPFRLTSLSDATGEIRYAMASAGLGSLFKGKRIKLKLQIMDRALNMSNTIETEPILIPG